MNRKVKRELEKLENKILKENIDKFGRKKYYEKIVEIYKPLIDAIKKEKQKLKTEGNYDLVTITDRFTGKEVKVHIGINLIDKAMRKGKRNLLKKILYGRIMSGEGDKE